MARGGRRPGAGRKPGSTPRPKAELEKERAFKAMQRAARTARREEKQEAEDAARREREAAREAKAEARAEKVKLTILPPLETPDIPPDVLPLEFLHHLMRDDRLPLGFRRDCAALALPFSHPKPILGLKDARNLAAWDDDEGDDEIANVMRGK